ncbi:VOC family protein [Xanthomonas sp. A2111]|uniref:VOC family protein n=1 Tax=Xanthomonas hawaiiensis TaxID=3003247 RepID=A0ABU2I6F6_9XANT|nr:VOC family protein [Xanthomonas sp. A2111]MBO9829717.1 VOC family protein [Xanthomonas sp. A2111]MDS9993410.1 VOC family protein [Xanthomonas sp. A2111]
MSHAEQHHRIDYLEFAVASIDAAKAFYGQAFDWSFQDYGPDYCEFRDGRLSGGFFHGTAQPGGALVVLYSTDLAATQARIEAAGGRIVRPVFAFPGGRRFHFADRDGYELAVWCEG